MLMTARISSVAAVVELAFVTNSLLIEPVVFFVGTVPAVLPAFVSVKELVAEVK
jgi:hypothetical protein